MREHIRGQVHAGVYLCIQNCPGCAYEQGQQDARKEVNEEW